MNNLYEMLLNIKVWTNEQVENIIENIISYEEEQVKQYTNDYEGLCKIFSNNIYKELKDYGFNIRKININEIDNNIKEHEFILLSYKNQENKINYILIDPTFIQFCKKNKNDIPIYFNEFPGEKLKQMNIELYNNLIKDKYTYINDDNIKQYINSFSSTDIDINLEQLFLNVNNNRMHK